MLVHRTDIPPMERLDFEQAIRASGKDPCLFKAQMFEATVAAHTSPLRRVHVACTNAAAQYDAGPGSCWTQSFARHLARGFYG